MYVDITHLQSFIISQQHRCWRRPGSWPRALMPSRQLFQRLPRARSLRMPLSTRRWSRPWPSSWELSRSWDPLDRARLTRRTLSWFLRRRSPWPGSRTAGLAWVRLNLLLKIWIAEGCSGVICGVIRRILLYKPPKKNLSLCIAGMMPPPAHVAEAAQAADFYAIKVGVMR